jgi:1,4-dihydroxy-2-naphthoate octaprenyltransferase
MNIGEKNVGTIDRIVRLVIGIAFLAGFALNMVAAPLSWLVLLVGLIALVTGIIGTCPAYSLMGINTGGKQG